MFQKYGASGGKFSESNYASNSALSFSVTWLTFYMRRHFCITCLWNCFIFHRIWRGLKVRNVYLLCAEQSPIYREFKYQDSIGIRWLFSWNCWSLFTGKNENTQSLHFQLCKHTTCVLSFWLFMRTCGARFKRPDFSKNRIATSLNFMLILNPRNFGTKLASIQ